VEEHGGDADLLFQKANLVLLQRCRSTTQRYGVWPLRGISTETERRQRSTYELFTEPKSYFDYWEKGASCPSVA
jgi:hypothetical protein